MSYFSELGIVWCTFETDMLGCAFDLVLQNTVSRSWTSATGSRGVNRKRKVANFYGNLCAFVGQ